MGLSVEGRMAYLRKGLSAGGIYAGEKLASELTDTIQQEENLYSKK